MLPKFFNLTFHWLWKDLFYPKRKAFVSGLLLELMSLGSQIVSYSILFRYLNSLEKDDPASFFNLSYFTKNSLEGLTIVAVILGLLFVFSGFSNYWSQNRLIEIAKQYDIACSNRVLSLLEKVTKESENIENYSNFDIRRLRKSLMRDSQFCAKTVQLFSTGVITGIKLTVSLAFMISINLALSLVIFLLIIPLFLLLRSNGKEVIKMTRLKEQQSPGFIDSKNKAAQDLISGQTKTTGEDSGDSFYDVHYGILKRLSANDLTIMIFIAILSVAIVMLAGRLVLDNQITWSVFIAYMIALRFFFTSIKGLNGIAKRVSRSYIYINHYLTTLQILQSKPKQVKPGSDKKTHTGMVNSPDWDDDDYDDI